MSNKILEKWAPGPQVVVDFNGVQVTTTVCEHNYPAIECPECDLFNQKYETIDSSSIVNRMQDPIGWLKIRLWIYKQNHRRSNHE